MNQDGNVTFRRAQARAYSDNIYDSSEKCTLDDTLHSVPGISEDEDNDIIVNLKKQIDNLTSKLCSANGEIDALILQNEKLKQENEDLNRNNPLYKQIATSPINSPIKTPKKRSKTKQVVHKNKHTQTDFSTLKKNKE